MDQSKVQAVVEWPAPQSVKELQWFLGFANFFSAGSALVHCSALVPCSAGSTSVPGHSTSTWTWPSFPPLLHLCSTALLVCIGASGSRSLEGAMSRILSMHFRSLTTRGHPLTTWTLALHYCCTSPRTTVPIIHCTDDTHTHTHTADCTDYTADSHHTPYLSHGFPQSDRRVLYSVYHSPSDSYSTEPT